MSATDPGAATGMIPPPPARCTCRHLDALHALNTRGQRAACSARGRDACGCRTFVAAGDDPAAVSKDLSGRLAALIRIPPGARGVKQWHEIDVLLDEFAARPTTPRRTP